MRLSRTIRGELRLNAIQQPTLVINGDHDVIIYTINSYILQQNIPNAQLILYPDASHGADRSPADAARARLRRHCPDCAHTQPI